MDNRIVLVTGASRGIGRAAALALAEAGNHIICLARSADALKALDDDIQKITGAPATLVPMDLRDFDAIDRLADALAQRFGRVDGVLGNAGVLGAIGPLESATPQSMSETLDINFTANWRLIRALHPLLRASPAGRALFVTSGASVRRKAFWGPYSASKAALDAMVGCYADEVENSTTRVNLFDPGATRTDMRFKAMPGEDPAILPTPAEVAATIPQFLAAECNDHGRRIVYRDLVTN